MQAGLEQWVPTFLIPRHLSAVLHALVTPATKLVSLLPHHFNFATIMNRNINIGYARYQLCDPQRGHDLQVENHWSRSWQKAQ